MQDCLYKVQNTRKDSPSSWSQLLHLSGAVPAARKCPLFSQRQGKPPQICVVSLQMFSPDQSLQYIFYKSSIARFVTVAEL